MSAPLLSIRGLDVSYPTRRGPARILTSVDISIARGEALGLVGESGSGKSTLALALLGLLPRDAQIRTESAVFEGAADALSPAEAERRRGRDVAMVFQDPMTSLNPLFTVGAQLVDIQRRKRPAAGKSELWRRGAAMLAHVGVPDAADRMRRYPHEFSGGMRQRVVIAMALLVEPKLLVADEPTTALDATVEAQIADRLRSLRREVSASMLIVSHSFGLIAELCDTVAVMYAGGIVEFGPVATVLQAPRHPYTQALLACEIDPLGAQEPGDVLVTIPGTVPDPVDRAGGCAFAPRCSLAHERCSDAPPWRRDDPRHGYACWLEATA